MTSPCDVTSSSYSELDSSELGVQLTVGRRLKHIAMKATFDQPRNKDSQTELKPATEFYASELLGSFIVHDQQQQLQLQQQQPAATTVLQAVQVPLVYVCSLKAGLAGIILLAVTSQRAIYTQIWPAGHVRSCWPVAARFSEHGQRACYGPPMSPGSHAPMWCNKYSRY